MGFARWLTFIFLFSLSANALDYKYPSSRRIDIDPELMAQCMLDGEKLNVYNFKPDATYETNFHPGASCEYSADYLFRYYLPASYRRACDYQTGNELVLRDWVLSQKDNTIDPVVIFKHALKLNNNNVFNAILTIHQLLRNEARWRNKTDYRYDSSVEKENIFWNKFMDIRGIESHPEGEEVDHAGSWYRMWGIALHQLSKVKIHDPCPQPSALAGNLTKVTGVIAEAIKPVIKLTGYKAGGDLAGKSRTNVAGAKMAIEMTDRLSGTALSAEDKKKCAEKKYLRRNYEFSPTAPVPDKSGY